MELLEAQAVIEALLFASGDAVSIQTLAEITELDIKTIRSLVYKMIDDYKSDGRGITIKEVNHSFQLCSKKEYYNYVKKLFNHGPAIPLSQAAYEVLAIIAYKQPVTRAIIENIRGVSSESSLNKLIERNYVRECGKLDAPGRPSLYEVTEEFLKGFGLRTIEDLPEIETYDDNSL